MAALFMEGSEPSRARRLDGSRGTSYNVTVTTTTLVRLSEAVVAHEGETPRYPFTVHRGETIVACKAVLERTAVVYPIGMEQLTEQVRLDLLMVDPSLIEWIQPMKKGTFGWNGQKGATAAEQRQAVRDETDVAALKDQARAQKRDDAEKEWARNPDPKKRALWNAERRRLEEGGDRRCYRCLKVKQLEAFSGGAEGRTGECQDCQRLYQNEYYLKTHPGAKSRVERAAARESVKVEQVPYDPLTTHPGSWPWQQEQKTLKAEGKRRCPKCRNVSPLGDFNTSGFCLCRLKGHGDLLHRAVKESEPEKVLDAAKLADADQRQISDALMKAALDEADPEEAGMLKAGYRLALERDAQATALEYFELVQEVAELRKEKQAIEKAIRQMVTDLRKALRG